MINLYAYSYPAAANKFKDTGYILLKLGDSHRDIEVRIIIGSWNNLQTIKRDHDLHEVLTKRGLWHSGKHKGTEWFKIPGNSEQEAFTYIDELVAEFEGKRVRKQVKLRAYNKKP